MHALHQEILPASGVEYAASLKLTGNALNVVVGRANVLKIFELDENNQFYLVREHILHGILTGIQPVKVLSSYEDGLERLLVSFKDAKIALLEWSEALHDLQTVSIHTYERSFISDNTAFSKSQLRVDPESRCAALSLPQDSLAILPFYQSSADLDDQQLQQQDIPYSPSFILSLPNNIHPEIQHAIDFVFLPGFLKPTIAVLFQQQQSWTGRLKEYKDTCKVLFFTLNLNIAANQPQARGQHAVISTVQGLPYDSLSILPCAASFGGVIVTTSNSLIYANASRRLVLPLNGWPTRISDLPVLAPPTPWTNLRIEGSRVVWMDDKTLLLILKDGNIYSVQVEAESGVTGLIASKEPIGRTTEPTGALPLSLQHDEEGTLIFVFSTAGPSVLVRASKEEVEVDEDTEMADAEKAIESKKEEEMDVDDYDEDIYGPRPTKVSETTEVEQTQIRRKTRSVISIALQDYIPGYGGINDITFTVGGPSDKPVPQLLASTGTGHLGGFSIFQRDLPTRIKRRPHPVGGMRGIWSLPIRPASASANGVNGIESDPPLMDTLVLSTDATPSPGLSRISVKSSSTHPSKPDGVQVTTRTPGLTIGAAPFFKNTVILHVMTNAIRVLAPDGSERQVIKDVDPATSAQPNPIPRAKIRSCSIMDPFVLIVREDHTIGLFVGEPEKGKIRRKDMSLLGDKASRYVAGGFFGDSTGLFGFDYPSPPTGGKGSAIWLILVRPQGTLEIWTLPKFSLAFSVPYLHSLQPVLTDSLQLAAVSAPQPDEPLPRIPQPEDVEELLIAQVGEERKRTCLFVSLRSGHFAVYEILPHNPASALVAGEHPNPGVNVETGPRPSTSSLKIKLVKLFSRLFERPDVSHSGEQPQNTVIGEAKKILRHFIPFSRVYREGKDDPEPKSVSGVFFTGENPHWIVGTDKGGLRMYPSGHSVVHSFSPCSLWKEDTMEFLAYTEEGPNVLEWIPGFSFTHALPSRQIPRERGYSNVTYDLNTGTIVAASNLQAEFTLYDEEGNQVWAPDAQNVGHPTTDCSTLELISTSSWKTMHGYEFANNEFVNSIAIVPLESNSSGTGLKEFVVVGTSINRGEDLAVKGATYIFEIVEVVPDPELSDGERWYKLKLRCKDDAKGPITAVTGINGYLVSSMGLKVFVRAFDQDERLVGVAFLDVGIYVTSIRVLKNLLLIGDAVKCTMFVAFQEDPFKLVTLAKDRQDLGVTCADFFFVQDELTLVTGNEEGVIRMYEYNPADPESQDGRYLLLRSEFHAQNEFRSSAMIARRVKDDPILPQAKLVLGMTNGALGALTPIDERTAKRLQLLQGQLTRNVQHVAGLNPKANRIVRNDFLSKPLSKGILDGTLLFEFENLSVTKQDEVTKQIGTEKGVIGRDLCGLSTPW